MNFHYTSIFTLISNLLSYFYLKNSLKNEICLFQRNEILNSLRENIRDTCDNLMPFFDTPLLMLQNAYNLTAEMFFKSYETLKEKSVISINFTLYFNKNI